MKTKNLAIYQGDTHLFKIALSDEKGEPLQTDGLSFALAVKFPDGETITPELTFEPSRQRHYLRRQRHQATADRAGKPPRYFRGLLRHPQQFGALAIHPKRDRVRL